jgi:hypothetical protein
VNKREKISCKNLTKRFGLVAICAVMLGAAALGLTACGSDNSDDSGKKDDTAQYNQINFENIFGDIPLDDMVYKFNGHWYDSNTKLQAAATGFFGGSMNGVTRVIRVGGSYYTVDQVTQYVKYNGQYYNEDEMAGVYKIGNDYVDPVSRLVYRTGEAGNYSYSDTWTAGAVSMTTYIKLDGTPIYFESVPSNIEYYHKLPDGPFITNEVYANLEMAYRFGADTKYYPIGDIYNGTIKQLYRRLEEGNYRYYAIDMGCKIGGIYYALDQIEFYYKVK